MPEISKERIEELAKEANRVEGCRSCQPLALEHAVRLGIREGLEVAAREAESRGCGPTAVGTLDAEDIRAISIEGER